MSIVFPCPNCGATQNVDDQDTSVQCQFCGNTIQVPENLRPKASAPAAPMAPMAGPSGPTTFSMGGGGSLPGMAGLPGMFMNMDLNKLRAMAMAARSGDKVEAARLYQETFGVSPEDAMQAADLMAQHHPVVLSHMQFNAPSSVVQMGGQAPFQPMAPSPSPVYNLPSPPVAGFNPRPGGASRILGCVAGAVVLMLGAGIAFAVIASALAHAR
jgi:hypothetical protein